MRPSRWFDSLRFRVTVGVLLPLLVVVSLLSLLRYLAYRNVLLDSLQRSATSTGELIESGLRQAMLTNNRSDIQQIIENIGRREEVASLVLLDKRGRVAASSGQIPVGTILDISNPSCQTCHGDPVVDVNKSQIVTVAPNLRVYRNVNAIQSAPECQACHTANAPVLGVLLSDFSLQPVQAALGTDRRNSILWTLGSILLILTVVNVMVNQLVVAWLERLVAAIRRLTRGDFQAHLRTDGPEEYRVLADAFNRMTAGLVERQQLERQLQAQTQTLSSQTQRLSTLNALALTVSQSLDLNQVLQSALDEVLESMRLQAGWVFLQRNEEDEFYLAAQRGDLGGNGSDKAACIWDHCEGWQILRQGQPRVFIPGHSEDTPQVQPVGVPEPLHQSSLSSSGIDSCLQGFTLRICVPLKAKDRILGVMTLAGDVSSADQDLAHGVASRSALDMLTAIGREVGIAVENARLYEELHDKEDRHRQLLERLITVQEAERRRIARELHDQTGQQLSSLIMTLDLLEKRGASPEVIAQRAQDLRQIATVILEQIHELALELRPSVLDDLGLLPALRNLFRVFRERFELRIDFQPSGWTSGPGSEHEEIPAETKRLPPEVETVLYRITQEALTNIIRHASARNVGILLEHGGDEVVLIVEDDGQGFDVQVMMGSHRQKRNLGLYGMQERAALVGGVATIESTPGKGTAILVRIPLPSKR